VRGVAVAVTVVARTFLLVLIGISVYNKYNPQGLEVLAFPCNQFGKQVRAVGKNVLTDK
jgi:hypothetical protein